MAVIATVLNERKGIAVLLDGFLRQTRPADEIVVVDGGSTDGTLDVLQDYARRHPSVRVFVEPGANIARGRNVAIHHSRADIVCVTDGGCKPEPDWIEKLVRPLVGHPEFGAVTGVRRIDAANRFEAYAGLLTTSGNAADEAKRVFHGRNSAFRKSLWQQVGGYPEWLYTAEDTLFAQRAKALGCRVALADSAVVGWRPRPTLRKVAKQYFLYGRGTGRIGASDLAAVRYHLRNHALWMLCLLVSPLVPLAALGAAAILGFMFRTLVLPVLRTTRLDGWAPYYVTLLVMTRSLANNLGQLYGEREYRTEAEFRRNLELYRRGEWRMAPVATA